MQVEAIRAIGSTGGADRQPALTFGLEQAGAGQHQTATLLCQHCVCVRGCCGWVGHGMNTHRPAIASQTQQAFCRQVGPVYADQKAGIEITGALPLGHGHGLYAEQPTVRHTAGTGIQPHAHPCIQAPELA